MGNQAKGRKAGKVSFSSFFESSFSSFTDSSSSSSSFAMSSSHSSKWGQHF